MELPESGSDSPVPQMLWGTVGEPVLGSLGHTEARDDRFLLLYIPDTEELRNGWEPSDRLSEGKG